MRVALRLVAFALCASSARAELSALPCEPSDALSEAAALLLLDGGEPTAESLRAAAREAGYPGPVVHASRLTDDDALDRWLTGLSHRADATLECGEALSDGARLVVAAPQLGRLSFRDGRLLGSVGDGFVHPHLVVQGADGRPRRLPASSAALREGVALPDELPLPARVQLVAEGPAGPRPLAEVEVSAPADAAWHAQQTRPEPLRSAARAGVAAGAGALSGLLARLDGFRQQLGASSLRVNQLLQQSAQRHARRVCELGQVAHSLARDDDPVRRLLRERVEARAVGEAIGRSRDADAALDAIFDSPSHRYAVTERRFTDVGLGHARDAQGRSCVVVLLAAWPRRIP